MKAVVLLSLVAFATAYPHTGGFQLLGNSLDVLITETLEYLRTCMRKSDSSPLPAFPQQRLADKDVDVEFSFKNVIVSKADTFTIDKVSNNLPKLTASFGVTVPQLHAVGEYVVSGTAFQKEVSGKGTFTVDVNHFVQNGDLQFQIVDHSLQIKTLKLDYELDSVHFDIQGLNIEGISADKVNDYLNNNLVKLLEDNKAEAEEKTANHVIEIANAIMKGKSLNDVIEFLKQLVASTPYPPPFPTFPTQA